MTTLKEKKKIKARHWRKGARREGVGHRRARVDKPRKRGGGALPRAISKSRDLAILSQNGYGLDSGGGGTYLADPRTASALSYIMSIINNSSPLDDYSKLYIAAYLASYCDDYHFECRGDLGAASPPPLLKKIICRDSAEIGRPTLSACETALFKKVLCIYVYTLRTFLCSWSETSRSFCSLSRVPNRGSPCDQSWFETSRSTFPFFWAPKHPPHPRIEIFNSFPGTNYQF